MSMHVFVVVPYAGKWGVSAGGQVLAVAETEAAARDLARKAGQALQPSREAHRETTAAGERRSFMEE